MGEGSLARTLGPAVERVDLSSHLPSTVGCCELTKPGALGKWGPTLGKEAEEEGQRPGRELRRGGSTRPTGTCPSFAMRGLCVGKDRKTISRTFLAGRSPGARGSHVWWVDGNVLILSSPQGGSTANGRPVKDAGGSAAGDTERGLVGPLGEPPGGVPSCFPSLVPLSPGTTRVQNRNPSSL